ncbi:MAG: hypothetical protein LBC02_00820 [Planctomycetaceae bacterium]|jgi:hypothetical protein|nr:hypothetical protein [Planctomycetaceae bacterium]
MRRMMLFVILGLSVIFWGCNKSSENAPTGDAHVHTAGDGHDHSDASASQETVHDVDGWCVAHEVPENICSLCNSKVAAELKKAGDWCNEHNRAESQCFICDSSLKEKFVAKYEAQYGKKTPTGKEQSK